eukprot:gene8932-biopygen14915
MKPLIALGTRQLEWTDSHVATGDKQVGDGDRPRDQSGQHEAGQIPPPCCTKGPAFALIHIRPFRDEVQPHTHVL